MRIISGKFKGRVLNPPGNLPVRPTTDFAKTGLFNLLENRIELTGLNCLDLFTGTGSISFELISRGCSHVTAVDQEKKCIRFIAETADSLGITNLSAIRSDAPLFLKRLKTKYDLIFADPPYQLQIHEEIHTLVFKQELLNTGGYFILEHSSREQFDTLPAFSFARKYGNVAFSFFHNLEPSQPEIS